MALRSLFHWQVPLNVFLSSCVRVVRLEPLALIFRKGKNVRPECGARVTE